ncbi:endoplasmic reticulum resident protein 44 [Plakobranchus ocellatus]|uniref:Endoplasmic reticulum resident protein 44 n=1 Tax=Plakobranchus ocellatus TaxID=259542 RepID=A0AAV4BI40_9GAST|nr:endoplasmic reticulum resident protein 44 [Plakobranchus ocellatus]
MKLDLYVLSLSTLFALCRQSVNGEAVSLNLNNVDSVLGASDLAIVNFYADWCKFSQILAPTFDEAGKKIHEEKENPGNIVFAKVDCDREGTLAARYRINKYPTLKIFRGGVMMKKEYRGQRSVEALIQFAKDETKPAIHDVESLDALNEIDKKKLSIIGFFDSKDSDHFRTFSRVASILRDDCQFHAAVGPVSVTERQAGDHINFRSSTTLGQDIIYDKNLNDFDALHTWATQRCTPLVREITFENAEELTEEGLPFVILFHHPDDSATPDLFRHRVQIEVAHEKARKRFTLGWLKTFDICGLRCDYDVRCAHEALSADPRVPYHNVILAMIQTLPGVHLLCWKLL